MQKKSPLEDIDKLRVGFNRFFNENGHYPNVFEIDSCPYLISSRHMQRIYIGGVKEVRRCLGIEITNYSAGKERSKVSYDVGKRGLEYEKRLQSLLVNEFGEMYVHEQKPFNNYKGRFDFVVYTKELKFGIDIFYSKDKRSFIGCLNSKIRIYKNIDFDIYLLQANKDLFNTFSLKSYLLTKKISLPENIKIVTQGQFDDLIKTFTPIGTSPS